MSFADDGEEVRVIYRDTRESPSAEKVALSTERVHVARAQGLTHRGPLALADPEDHVCLRASRSA